MTSTIRVLLVAATLALGGCNAETSARPGASPNGPSSGAATEPPLELIVNDPGGVSMMAALNGVITRVGACFGLDGTTTSWPYGTKVLPGNRIELYGRTYGLGDRIEVGGGVLSAAPDLDLSKEVRPEGCPMTDQFYVLANDE